MYIVKQIMLFACLYFVCGVALAFPYAIWDIVHDDFDEDGGYLGLVVCWPFVILFAVITFPFWIFDKLLSKLNESINGG